MFYKTKPFGQVMGHTGLAHGVRNTRRDPVGTPRGVRGLDGLVCSPGLFRLVVSPCLRVCVAWPGGFVLASCFLFKNDLR